MSLHRCDHCHEPVKVATAADTDDPLLIGMYQHDNGNFAAWYCPNGWDTWAQVNGLDQPPTTIEGDGS